MAKAKATPAPPPKKSRTPGEMVELFIKLRDHKKASDEEYKKSMERVNLAMEKLEAELLQHLIDQDATSLKAATGTVYRTTRVNASVENRAQFLEWLDQTGELDALDVKANKSFMESLLEAGKELPPGVKISAMHTIGVRRS